MQRNNELEDLHRYFNTSKVVALLGPRQCGKTTLARDYFKKYHGLSECYFDLEDPHDLLRLSDPMLTLEEMKGLIVMDEIQRVPDLFPVLRVLVDKKKPKQHYLILGSASRDLIQQSSESLAGRIHYRELTPFSYGEVSDLKKLWLRGGFPLSYLARSTAASMQWRLDYVRTFLEQDIPALGIRIPTASLRRFWMMLAHYHGQIMNASEIGNALDLSHHTVQKYLDILSGTFMVRQLAPWHENIAKRQVKAKKIYFRDSGIFHTLLNIPDRLELLVHPKLGASWEGFALEEVIRHLNVDAQDCYFWNVHNGPELDLLIVQGTKRMGFEFKFSKTPQMTHSMQQAMKDLKLKKLTVIYPGTHLIKLSRQISAIGLESFLKNK
ncbi:MAG: ATP-binding protein [Chthoniobacterales bacterium]